VPDGAREATRRISSIRARGTGSGGTPGRIGVAQGRRQRACRVSWWDGWDGWPGAPFVGAGLISSPGLPLSRRAPRTASSAALVDGANDEGVVEHTGRKCELASNAAAPSHEKTHS
jgi:hypothetical protein